MEITPLPEDGSLSSLREVEMDADDELELQTTDDPNIQDSASFVPVVVRKMTEEGKRVLFPVACSYNYTLMHPL